MATYRQIVKQILSESSKNLKHLENLGKKLEEERLTIYEQGQYLKDMGFETYKMKGSVGDNPSNHGCEFFIVKNSNIGSFVIIRDSCIDSALADTNGFRYMEMFIIAYVDNKTKIDAVERPWD